MSRLTTIEHDRIGYMLDCGFFATAVVVLSAALVYYQPPHSWRTTLAYLAFGFMSWTLIEYFLHRCIMHGLQPYKSWHEEHHRRPKALIVTPFAMSASTALAIVALALWLAPTIAAGLSYSLGMLVGYCLFTGTHHAVHHFRVRDPWFSWQKRRHAIHHAYPECNYGVSSAFWDVIFGTRAKQVYKRDDALEPQPESTETA